ncbi:hypothetical protein AX14_010835 [Amanita brunnescens Koide BX004]|nr:hypothetical protein AX14_010835 [Amanita brunnescens Koide BX004]
MSDDFWTFSLTTSEADVSDEEGTSRRNESEDIATQFTTGNTGMILSDFSAVPGAVVAFPARARISGSSSPFVYNPGPVQLSARRTDSRTAAIPCSCDTGRNLVEEPHDSRSALYATPPIIPKTLLRPPPLVIDLTSDDSLPSSETTPQRPRMITGLEESPDPCLIARRSSKGHHPTPAAPRWGKGRRQKGVRGSRRRADVTNGEQATLWSYGFEKRRQNVPMANMMQSCRRDWRVDES